MLVGSDCSAGRCAFRIFSRARSNQKEIVCYFRDNRMILARKFDSAHRMVRRPEVRAEREKKMQRSHQELSNYGNRTLKGKEN